MSNLSPSLTITRRVVVIPPDAAHIKAAYDQSFKLLASLLAEQPDNEAEKNSVLVAHTPSVVQVTA